MPRPGFYNDNEYRAYPFVYKTDAVDTVLPDSAIVDAGFIVGIDVFGQPQNCNIWLTSITRTATDFIFTFTGAAANGITEEIVFAAPDNDDDWTIVYSESEQNEDESFEETGICGGASYFSGFIVVGPRAELRAAIAQNSTLSFFELRYQIEHSRLQFQHKAYLNTLTVANFERIKVPACDEETDNDYANRRVVVAEHCLRGDIKFMEGYNCQIVQTNAANEILVTAAVGAGIGTTTGELCELGGQLPLTENERTLFLAAKEAGTQNFLSGGPACSELISTINGLPGPNINIIGGVGIRVTSEVTADGSKIIIAKNPNAHANCVN